MKRILQLVCLIALVHLGESPLLSAQISSPEEYFNNDLGEQFLYHHDIASYFRHCAERSDRMELVEYGETYQGRPLLHAVITSGDDPDGVEKRRMAHLETTLSSADSRESARRAEGNSGSDVVVWLSYGVHGNEAGASNTAPYALYELLTMDAALLQDMIVIVDPCLNPDGYSRYTHWYRDRANRTPNPKVEAAEHHEPAPTGRVNHYRHDLNRDWAWLTQTESRHRIRAYRQWMPHIHVDVHEQGHNSPYYFAPAAIPYHEYITQWQQDFQHTIGKQNAEVFDKEGWLYFTQEIFDLLYPSYGDTYPTFRGAIGMTYEQAGHGMAGLAINLENGRQLKLSDRIKHHRGSTIETVKTAAKHRAELLDQWSRFYSAAAPGKYKSYLLRDDGSERLVDLLRLLDAHGITYGHPSRTGSVRMTAYTDGQETSVEVQESDVLISVDQQDKVLLQVLMDPTTSIEDSLTYDITAWSLPRAFGVEAYASTSIMSQSIYELRQSSETIDDEAYAYLLPWNSLADARFLAAVQSAGLRVRVSQSPFTADGRDYDRGTLVILRGENDDVTNYVEIVRREASKHSVDVYSVQSGWTESGPDLGSGQMSYIRSAKIAVLTGDAISSYSHGEVWHLLEQELEEDVTVMEISQISGHVLHDYTCLILPSGRYSDISEDQWSHIRDWVAQGGKLIALGGAYRSMSTLSGFDMGEDDREDEEPRDIRFADQERDYLRSSIPGAIFATRMDDTHPLSYGIGSTYYSLVTGSAGVPRQEGAWNVTRWSRSDELFGFAGSKAIDLMNGKSIHLAQRIGSGQVIYLTDNPLFRSFWYEGKLLFCNAMYF